MKKQFKRVPQKNSRPAILGMAVGSAFDFISGIKSQAPLWIQKLGLEWLFRMSQEPRRLWRRYFFTNSRFLFLILREIFLENTGKIRG